MKFKIEKLGFKVIELQNGQKNKLNKNFSLNIFAADNCNPELCYKFNGCADLNIKDETQQIDSMAVISDEKFNLLNVNDCPFSLAKSTLEDIKKKYSIDLLLLGYGGAGPYPQCFENLNDEEKIEEANKKINSFLEMSINFIKSIKPKFYMPFAGTYVLTGKLSKLQEIRGVPHIDQAHTYIKNRLNSSSEISSHGIKLNTDCTFCLKTKSYTKKYIPMDQKLLKTYIKEVLSNKKFSYENDEQTSLEEIFELSKISHKRYLAKKKYYKINLDTNLLLKYFENFVLIDNNSDTIKIINHEDLAKLNKYVIYDVDPKLLKRILKGPKFAHWNNAEIGSHIKFSRKPNIYDRKLYNLMSYFHC